MSDTDFITAHLSQLRHTALSQRRQLRLQRHWRPYPALAGRTPSQVADIAADAYHRDHNAVAAALLAAHRARVGQPTDAEMAFLLCAARPMVLLIDPSDRYGDSRASVWSSVACRLARLDPDEIAASATPFLVALLGRIRPDAAKHPSEPRRLVVAHEAQFDRLAERRVAARHDTANRAIARVYLDAASRHRSWDVVARHLLDLDVDHTPSSTVSRHRRQIARHIGYVA